MSIINSARNNKRIREALKELGMYQWELAELLGVSEPTITRWLRHELPDEMQNEILEIIASGNSSKIPPKKIEC